LRKANPWRRKTAAAKVPLVGPMGEMVEVLLSCLDARMGSRLPIILAGAMLAKGRRTASRWFQAAGVQDDWDRFYDALITTGKSTLTLVLPLLRMLFQRFDPGPDGHWLLGIDDTPTKRYGRHVEGANVHRNPTPGPAGGPWLFGHCWVVVSLLQTHPLWGIIPFSLLSWLYVRETDIPPLKARYGWKFKTKHALAAQLIEYIARVLRGLGSQAKMIATFDGAYAAAPLLKPLKALQVIVVSRLRRDAELYDLPEARRIGQRGRPRVYGKNRISLAKRAGHRFGWDNLTYDCRGEMASVQYKTFLSTAKLTGDVIRVVLVTFDNGSWAAYFSTDPSLSAQQIIQIAAARWGLEEHFHDVKEVWGAGEQQVRNIWSNIGCWHLNSWLYTMVEMTCWDVPAKALADRSERSWDNSARRPSHADRRRYIARQMLRKTFSRALATPLSKRKSLSLLDQILSLAT
jgi:DDE superfamily endonuclease